MAFNPKGITKEHVLKAVERIEKEGLSLRPSTKFDVMINGTAYPPKEVMRYAHQAMNGEYLWELSGGPPTNKLLGNMGFNIVAKADEVDLIAALVVRYKMRLKKQGLKDELYKWELAKEFNGRPDVAAEDFSKEVDSINFANLIYNLGISVIKGLAKNRPEELRAAFGELFDDKRGLQLRLERFSKSTLNAFKKLEPGINHSHHQDERTMATYLAYYDSSKYAFYKASFYRKYCDLLGVKPAKSGNRYVHYMELLREFIDGYVADDTELLELQRNSLNENCYNDEEHLILAQDILYTMLDSEPDSDTEYWLFQGNPDVYDVIGALRNDHLLSWQVKQNADKIKSGDKVIIWVSGKQAGCYALAEVISEVSNTPAEEVEKKYYKKGGTDGDTPNVKLKIKHNLAEDPITKEEVSNVAALDKLDFGRQGTNFVASNKQYEALIAIINNRKIQFREFLKQFDTEQLSDYTAFLGRIIRHFNLQPEDERLVFSIRDNRLNFIVGQRYCWVLYIASSQKDFGVISLEKLTETAESFEGKPPQPYFNELADGEFSSSDELLIFSSIKEELARSSKSSFRKFNNPDFEHLAFQKTTLSTMSYPLNQILYGPPGTGKTYHTINKALEICGEDVTTLSRSEMKQLFDEKVNDGQIVFTTFHQSMSYEDFIEGLKPIEPEKDGDQVIYRVEYGILRNICIEASFSVAQTSADKSTRDVIDFSVLFDRFVESVEERLLKGEEVALDIKGGGTVVVDSISQQGNIIIKHHNGSRTYTVSKLRTSKLQHAIADLDKVSNINDKFREIIGGSNSTAYWAVLNAIRKAPKALSDIDNVKTFTFEEKKAIVAALRNADYKNKTGKPFVLIIDEINRGNISQIFGELITLIEEDKRLGNKEALEVLLPYSKEKFGVPSNLYIIGTMNTADRSVEALDTALRRRFSFEEMPPISALLTPKKMIIDLWNREELSKLDWDDKKYRAEADRLYSFLGIDDSFETSFQGPEAEWSSGIWEVSHLDSIDDEAFTGVNLQLLLEKINRRIEKLIDKDHLIGHSYFLGVDSIVKLQQAFHNKMIPLLQEYFFGDIGKIGLILGTSFFETEEPDHDDLFAEFDYEVSGLLERKVYHLKNVRQMDESDFEQAVFNLMK